MLVGALRAAGYWNTSDVGDAGKGEGGGTVKNDGTL